jgi:MFS family permease
MNPRAILTLGNFFAVAHFYLIVYIITPYLAAFMPQAETGLVVSLGAIITLVMFPLMPKLVRRYGTRHLAIYFGIAQAILLGLLALGPTSLPAFFLVALACATSPLISYQMDLLLEATVQQEDVTGRIRTLFLTAGNIALVFAPLVIGSVLNSTDAYWRVFAIAAATLIPYVLLMSLKPLPHGSSTTIVSLAEAFQCLMKNEDTRATVIAHGTLQFFYHLAPLYIPLYLHIALGIPWGTLGWMFMIMLLPFVFLEYPAGWLADRKWGDKEIMMLGFIITGISMAALAFVNANTMILVILIIITATRVGTALIEAMTEGHFFRRVSKDDDASVGIFRMTRPVAALTAPILGSVLLSLANYATLFIVTGALVGIVGAMATSKIKDFK